MRILIVGAGAIGGYFGARLLEKGEDVTFLVREKRNEQLKQKGLIVHSIHGDVKVQPKTIVAGDEAGTFDVVFITTKAYHLHGALESIRPYVGKDTMILPLLNGIAHMNELVAAFGNQAVIGGLCFIETTLTSDGVVVQTSPIHDLVFGERNGEKTDRIIKLEAALSGTKASFRLSKNIMQDMWHKYLFIMTLSGVTSLFRSPIGPIREDKHGLHTIEKVLSEVAAIMNRMEAPLAENIETIQLERVLGLGYEMKSSLQRDMEKGLPVEADHFFGYLLDIGARKGIEAPTLGAIYANLKIYEQLNVSC